MKLAKNMYLIIILGDFTCVSKSKFRLFTTLYVIFLIIMQHNEFKYMKYMHNRYSNKYRPWVFILHLSKGLLMELKGR